MSFKHFTKGIVLVFKLKLMFLLCLFFSHFISNFCKASVYVGTQDKQLHYDLQTLAEWGYLDLSVTSFPVPWKGISEQLNSLNTSGMDFRPQQAYMRLRHYLGLAQQQQGRQYFSLELASDNIRFKSFDDSVENKGKATFSSEFYHGAFSGQISANYLHDGKTNLDNSFIAYQFGDWHLRLGSIEQWWGPAQSSSLIMSNNARPIKALALSRSHTMQSKSPWLSWLGPWHFSSQIGQMESSRTVSEPRLLMNRFTSRPLKGLEIGLSWVAMFGGQGQEEGLSEFIELITFESVCLRTDEVCGPEQLSKRGNHLAGIDITYTWQIFNRPFTFYLQRIGEDSKKGIRVTDNANLFGFSSYIGPAKIFFETSDTNVACSSESSRFNCYYEHGLYVDGYRLYGRAIGSTFDSDAKQVTIGSNIRFKDGAVAELYLRQVELNQDASLPSPLLNLSPSEEVIELSGFYQRPFKKWLVKTGASLAQRRFENIDDEIDTLIYLKAQYAF